MQNLEQTAPARVGPCVFGAVRVSGLRYIKWRKSQAGIQRAPKPADTDNPHHWIRTSQTHTIFSSETFR